MPSLDPDRNWWGDNCSQFTAQFEIERFTTLLHLEGVTAEYLVAITGISDNLAERLTYFAMEDIQEIRANIPCPPKWAWYD